MSLMRLALGTEMVTSLGGSGSLAMALAFAVGASRFLQIFVSLRVHPANGKRFMLINWALYALTTLAAMALPSLMGPGPATAYAVVGVLTVSLCFCQIGGTFWFPLLHDVVPSDRRGRFFSALRAIWSTSLFAFNIAAGLFLGAQSEPWRFQVIFALAAVGVGVRIALVARIPEATGALAEQDDFGDWRRHARSIFNRPEVISFWVYYSIVGFCIGFLGQPLVLYMRQMGFATRDNVLIYGFRVLGMILALTVAGRLVDRVGTKRVFLAVHLVLCVVCFLAAVLGWAPRSVSGWAMPVLLVVAGAILASGGVACTTQLFHFAPQRGRAFFLCLVNVMIYVSPAFTALTVGIVLSVLGADARWSLLGLEVSIFQALLLTAGAGLLAALLRWRHVQDVRPETP